MLLWSIQISIISIILIFLVHHLIVFFKNTLTIPKVKDLVNAPIQKYEDMYEIIHSSKKMNENSNTENGTSIHSIDELIPKSEGKQNISPTATQTKNMKDELKSFFKKQLNMDKTENTVDSLSSYNSSSNNFSFY